MTADFLNLDIGILLARYGRQRVLGALAEADGTSLVELEKQLEKIKAARAGKTLPVKKSLVERFENEFRHSPERLSKLRPLIVAFENRSLFPTLKSAQRFLQSHGKEVSSIKSRTLAGPHVLQVIASLSSNELEELNRELRPSDGKSDFSLLSDAILSKDRRMR
jgi:hypothetical protein